MQLKNVVPWGRSVKEYRQIFNLTDADLTKKILGCGDGPASFNAELTKQGGQITSIDPTYCFSANEIKTRIAEVYEEIMPQMHANQDKYLWDSIPSVEALGEVRLSAMNSFLEDFELGKQEGRYIEASLPQLPFKDKQFDLALCSHYLFLYSAHVSLEAHIQSVQELCRVAQEVRIYPLVTLEGTPSPYLDEVMSLLKDSGYSVTLEKVSYQFQKGATEMLVIKD